MTMNYGATGNWFAYGNPYIVFDKSYLSPCKSCSKYILDLYP